MHPGNVRKTPELSVIVIAYNNELYIEEALESLDEQTFDDMEVVVVNDASTDRTGEIIDQFVSTRPKFRAIHLSRNSGGCSVPRNTGIANSSGRYIMFLDGDDWYAKDACELMVNAIKRTGSDFVSGQVVRTNTYEIWYHKNIYSVERTNINIREFPELIFDSLSVNKIYKRSFLEKHNLRFPEGIHYEDIVFTGKAYFLAESISIIPKPIYYWRVVEKAAVKSITNRRSEIHNFKHRLTAHRLLDQFLIDNGDSIYLLYKNNKFLRHDLKLYVNDYHKFDEEYKSQFHEYIREYLHERINKYEFAKLAEDSRIMYYLLYIDDREAFQDYLSYVQGKPTKEDRLRFNGDYYYFWSAKSPESDQKFLKINDPKITYAIQDISLAGDMFRIKATAVMHSAARGEYSYCWRLKHKQTGTIIDPQSVDNDVFVFDLTDVELGNYLLVLFVNHMGISHERKVRASEISGFPNIQTRNHKRTISTHISPKNFVGLKLEPTKKWDKIKWMVRRRALKTRSKQPSRFFSQKAVELIRAGIRKLPIRSNWVLFESHMGKQYSDNPKYIYEELLKTDKHLKFIWSFENPDAVHVPGPAIKVKRGSLKHYYYMTRAKYWVDNQGMAHLAPKRKGQIYLQTWHGTPLKKMGIDQKNISQGRELNRLKHQVSAWDYFITPNRYSTEIFKRAFLYQKDILETGYPRNDILVKKPEEICEKVRRYFNLSHDKRVVLFAPTFRDWNSRSFYKTFKDIQLLSQQVDDNTVILLRLHYLLAAKASQIELSGNVINASLYPDIQELYLITDVLITDYSSVMFDFAVLRRPIILYCYDLEEYVYHRGTYFDIVEHAPGPVCRTIEEVIDVLKNPATLIKYNDALNRFAQTFAELEDGHASERVIEKVFK